MTISGKIVVIEDDHMTFRLHSDPNTLVDGWGLDRETIIGENLANNGDPTVGDDVWIYGTLTATATEAELPAYTIGTTGDRPRHAGDRIPTSWQANYRVIV